MPESSGMAFSNFLNASSPPADAPMPTTGNRLEDLMGVSSVFSKAVFAAVFDTGPTLLVLPAVVFFLFEEDDYIYCNILTAK